MKWDASYVVQIGQSGSTPRLELLTTSRPILFKCDWSPSFATQFTPRNAPNRAEVFKDYFFHGIGHIFNLQDPGYDHLLFVTALVFGATTLWELFTLVTAFTLAHTITLTLAALNLVHVPERVVEPLIGAEHRLRLAGKRGFSPPQPRLAAA